MAQIAVGESHACGLRRDGAIACWGSMYEDWPDDAGWTQVTSGQDFSCGLRGDGPVACWGDDAHGKADPPEGRFVLVNAGKQHACALGADGAAACWGWDVGGRTAAPADEAFAAIGAGDTHGCALARDGALRCWGGNEHGQADDRTGPFRALAVGVRHTCALREDGTAFCQGEGGEHAPPDTAFERIEAGGGRTCGITAAGALSCWGEGPPLAPPGQWASVGVGWHETCAVRAGGAAECWPHDSASPRDPRFEYALGGRSLDQPVELFPWPGGGLAVADRRGSVEVYASEQAPPRTVLDLTGRTRCCIGESGMLGAAPDPDFEEFPFLYVYWQTDGEGGGAADGEGGGETDGFRGRLSRFPITDGRAVAADELIILDLPQEGRVHFGGGLRFGPDGMLYLSLGDRAVRDAPGEAWAAQDLGTLAGKIVRIDVRGATAARPYRIPGDNPFAAAPGARPEIWAYGLRNPWRIGFDAEGRLWVGDVGAHAAEEVTIAEAGANLGWPLQEGDLCLSGSPGCADTLPPAAAYGHEDGNCVVVGGVALPEPDGRYVFGDFCSGRVWALEGDPSEGWRMRELLDLPLSISSFGTGRDGEVYVLTFGGPVIRLVAGAAEDAAP